MTHGKEDSGLHLYSAGAPSGYRATILIEELGIPYALHKVDLSKGEHLTPEFKQERNPAQLIPVLVDEDEGGLQVFESGALMMYLLECKAPAVGGDAASLAAQLLPPPSDPRRRAPVLSWLFWIAGTGYAAVRRFFEPLMVGAPCTPDTHRHAAKVMRERLQTLSDQLEKTGAYVAGGFYSVADIACLPYAMGIAVTLGVDTEAEMPALHAWAQRLFERPAVRRGLRLPEPYSSFEAGAEGDAAVEGFRAALKGMGLEDLDVGAPRLTVPE